MKENRVLSYDKKMRGVLPVTAQHQTLGSITDTSLKENIAQFQKEVNNFKQKNKINYSMRERDEDLQKKYPRLNLNEDISELDSVPAIELTDGSILPIKDRERYRTHVSFIEGNRIDVDDLRSGGWIGNGVYDASFTSDTARYIEQQQAKKRVAELRGVPYDQFGDGNIRYSMRDTAYTTAVESGNTEAAQRLVDEAAEEALENSEARLTDRGEFRMGAGKLATVYHATYNDFTVFDRAKLGENTDAYASDESTAATAHLGFWFNTQPLSQSANYAGGKDVKAWLGALRAATAVGSRAPCGACGLKFLLFCVGMYLIWSRLAWGALYDTGIKEVMEKVTEGKANMLSHSDQIFSNAEYLYSLPGYEGNLNIYRWNYFYTPVQIGDTTVGVRIAIRDMVMPAESQIYSWGIKRPQPWTVAARRKPPCPPVPHQPGKQTPPWTVQGACQAMAAFPAVSHQRRRKLPLPLLVYPQRRMMSSFTTCGVCGLK